MISIAQDYSLRGHLLIATTGLRDSMFRRSVVFVCAHSPNGALGLMINRPAADATLTDLLPGYTIPAGTRPPTEPIYAGGPAEIERGFVLHSPDYDDGGETLRVDGDFAMTASKRVIRDLIAGRGPVLRLVTLGYAGWGPGQLDTEVRENSWLTVEATPALVFTDPGDDKWRDAIAAIGIDLSALPGLSAHHGHA
ncbi:MAG: YqgE/AlgH family protein [Pseudomonadota bacterium]